MTNALLGQKKEMRQVWTKTGVRVPVTKISVRGNVVVQARPGKNEGDAQSVQLGFGDKQLKNMPKPQRAILEKSGIQMGKRIFKETTAAEGAELNAGQVINVESVFAAGDLLTLTSKSKGKGFAGVMKRHGFHGGPRTHGQSDRERAPGAIGNRTTPGRVFKGKRMAGRMGGDNITLDNRVVIAVDQVDQSLWIQGTLPGSFNGLLTLVKQDGQREIELLPESLTVLVPQSAEVAVEAEEVAAEPEMEAEVAVTEVAEAPEAEAAPQEETEETNA